MTTRRELLEEIWRQLKAARGLDEAGRWPFLAGAWRFDVHPVYMQGSLVGCVMQDGPELHVCAFGPVRASVRGVIRRHLEGVLRTYGYARATVMRHNTAGLAFCRRLGFTVDSQDEEAYHLTCREARYAH